MNITVPVSWLREYLKTDAAAKTIAQNLTLCGPSVEKIKKVGTDHLFDIEVTTNRPDAFSVWGIGREARSILANQGIKSTLTPPKGLDVSLQPDTAKKLKLDVVIKEPGLCPRFSAIVVSNVKIKPSPALIKNRLEKAGIRPINNIVDVTNYVMLELGQPMHAFDYDKIKGGKMILRKSTTAESIKTIDDTIRKLPAGSIVIQDAERLIDLCGIMGAANSKVTTRTKNVVLFVQSYNGQVIRKTTQQLAFRTDASVRFEKGVDIEGIIPALSRSLYLAKKTSGAKIASELTDIYLEKQKAKIITLGLKKLETYLGISIIGEKAAKILASLGFNVSVQNGQISAVVPSYRAQDVEDDVDLIEEIARIYGYHNLPSKLKAGTLPTGGESDLKEVIELKCALKYLGLTETITYSIISKNMLKVAKTNPKTAVELLNPLTEEWQFMRPQVLPSLLDVFAKNQNLPQNLDIFEVARTYHPKIRSLPQQDLNLTVILDTSDFYKLKGLLANIFDSLQRKASWQLASKPNTLFENNQLAEVKIGGEAVGFAGLINRQTLEGFGIEKQVAAAEINLTKLLQQLKMAKQYKPIAKYPPVIEDLSFVVAKVLPIGEIIAQIKKADLPLVKKIDVLDIFEDIKLGGNKKSVTLRLYFQKVTSTPTMEEANEVKQKIADVLIQKYRAKVR